MAHVQLALDMTDLDRALEVAKAAAPFVDIIEAGTPLIKAEGMRAVARLVETFPNRKILADLKTMDVGEAEAALVAEAGGHYTTVMGAAPDPTVRAVVRRAHKDGLKVLGDLLGVHDPTLRAGRLLRLGVDIALVHLGIDQQEAGDYLLGELGGASAWEGIPLAVAGGLDPRSVSAVSRGDYPVELFVVGGFVTGADDPAEAAAHIRRIVDRAR